MIKIIIVDDHKLFRNGLKFILSEIKNINVIAEADNGKDFLNLLKIEMPDIVMMDIKMPVMDGVEATREALRLYPELKIVVLSMFGDEEYYNSMINLGVKGFLLKDAETLELKTAIKMVHEGGTYFSQQLLAGLIKNKNQKEPIDLTKREKDVLQLICKGLSTSQIAEKLFLSTRTIERHRSNLLMKTNSPNSVSLALFAIKNQLVTI